MRALIVRWLGHRLDERVACEIRNTDRMADSAARLAKSRDNWAELYRSMRRERDRLLADLTTTRVELANLRAQRGVTPR